MNTEIDLHVSSLKSLSATQRNKYLASLSEEEARFLWYHWPAWRRPEQSPPEWEWGVWLLMAGRGHGKTRVGAEWICEQARTAREVRHFALVSKTPADAREVMVDGESGILAVSPPDEKPLYEPSKRRLTWKNGCWATIYSSKEYDTLRGPQHHGAWCDELCAWHFPQQTWDNLMMGMRLGNNPQTVVTTTPKRIPLLKDLLSREGRDVAVTRGSTYDNIENLAPAFINTIVRKYEGTTLGRQELHAVLLDDVEGALWKRAEIDVHRVVKAPDLSECVVGVDPSVGDPDHNDEIDEAGIIVVGRGVDMHGYVLDDRTLRGSPDAWARAAVTAYHAHRADKIVAEANNGGEMVRLTIHTIDPSVPVELVHASRGKRTRAEPVAALYEQGKVHHVGTFAALEDEQCSWLPGQASPNRMDALVWGATKVMVGAVAIVMPAGASSGGSKWAVG